MTPELIAILAVGATLIGVGATLIGLLLALWRDARARHASAARGSPGRPATSFREEFRADRQSFREEVRADLSRVFREEARAEVWRSDLADLRTDVQALTERMSRVEGAIEGLFAGRDRRNDAA